MEGVHCGEPGLRGLHLSGSLDLVEISKPLSSAEVLIVKRLFQSLLVDDGLRNKFKMNEGAGQESAVRIFEDLQCPFSIAVERSGSGQQYAAIEECPDHSGLANPAPALR